MSSVPAGINCPTVQPCSAYYPEGSSVTLTESPAAGSAFAGWSGSCSGKAITCTVTMSQAQAATATFNSYRPDLWIAYGTKPAIGDNIYNSTGAQQTWPTVKLLPGKVAAFTVTVQNDAASADTIKVKGAGKKSGFSVVYLFNGSTNITTGVTGGRPYVVCQVAAICSSGSGVGDQR